MEQLQNTLEQVHRKRVSDSVWAAADAAHYVLTAFRDQVNKGTLDMGGGAEPYFTFDPYSLPSPEPGAGFAVENWEKHSEYVLNIIRTSTGLDVKWLAPGGSMMLRRKPQGAIAEYKRRPYVSEWSARGPPMYSMVCGGNGDAVAPAIAPCPVVGAVFKGLGRLEASKPPCPSCPTKPAVIEDRCTQTPTGWVQVVSPCEDESYVGGGSSGASDIEILNPEEPEKKPESSK